MGIVGIDIGGSSVKAVRLGAADAHTRVESRAEIAEPSPDHISAAFREISRSLPIEPTDRVAVCLPGLIDQSSGIVLRASNLPRMIGVSPTDLVRESIGIMPARVMTDAAAWGLGVLEREKLQGRLLVLAIGTGVGAAFMVHGQAVTLDGVTPGHVGMIDVALGEADPPRTGDGTPGVLEAYVGRHTLSARFGNDRLADAIARLDAGDPAIRALAKALRICHAIYKPDAIRLVGGVGAMLTPCLQLIETQTRDGLSRVAQNAWTLDAIDDIFLAAQGAARSIR